MSIIFSRRNLLVASGAMGLAGVLAGCSGDDSLPASTSEGSDGQTAFTQDEYDELIRSGPVADDAAVEANSWASAIKSAGVLKRGGTDTGAIFSLRNPTTDRIMGFDAGIGDLLAHYILGSDAVESLTELSLTSTDTRETMLQNNTVDIVVATYSITPARAEKVDFAGPYMISGTAVQVMKSNDEINSYEDLNESGKRIVTESNSSAITAVEEFIPNAEVTLLTQNEDCVQALRQGRVDAYILDQSILLSNAVSYDDIKVVGEPFTTDPYGLGLPKDTDAKEFVNTFLQTIFDDGTWDKLYEGTISPYMSGDVPDVPAIGSVEGS